MPGSATSVCPARYDSSVAVNNHICVASRITTKIMAASTTVRRRSRTRLVAAFIGSSCGFYAGRDQIVTPLLHANAGKRPWRRSLQNAAVFDREVAFMARTLEPVV